MGISKRLKTIAELVTAGNTAADIGTDHGYVPIYLLQKNISPFVYACDMSAGALSKAEEKMYRYSFEDRMQVRCADGLSAIEPGEADTIIISGMGGILMTKILGDSPDVTHSAKELVLSPHRDAELVRRFIAENDFEIIHEEKIIDKKKEYIIFKAVNLKEKQKFCVF